MAADELADAFDELVGAVAQSAAFVRDHPFYDDPDQRPGAYAFLTGMLLARLEEEVAHRPDHPTFRVIDPRIREGGDNPDQRYLMSALLGGEAYRIWGRLGSARRIDVQIYAGEPFVPESGGRSASFLTFEEIDFADDGSFSIVASPERVEGDWLENPADGSQILVRQVYGEWTTDWPGEVHIDRIGHEGELRRRPSVDDMVGRLRKAAHDMRLHTEVWPEMVRRAYIEGAVPANQVSEPFDPGTLGGVPGRWMAHGTWELESDEALVIRTWPASGNYQGIQLTDLWFSSLEYANRQTSLTADQAHADPDGSFAFVVAGFDPEVPNWLDTTGLRRGVILLRYDGTTETTFDADHRPTATKVGRADIADALDPGTPRVDADARWRAIEARRRHVQVRFGF